GVRYALEVTNETPRTLAATAIAVRTADSRPVAAVAVEVRPHAWLRTGFTLDPSLQYERVSAEVRGEGIQLVVDAPPPAGGKPPKPWALPAFAVGAAAVLAGITLMLVGAERPRVLGASLDPGPHGRMVAHWATIGNGTRTYELRDASGTLVARGPLDVAQGALDLGPVGGARLRVAIGNFFGSDVREATYARAAAPAVVRIRATPPPRIVRLAVDPPRANAPLTVHYAAIARSVRLAIVDRSGATWFSTTTGAGAGVTEVPAPPPGAREPYALVAHAANGSASEDVRVPLLAARPPAKPAPARAGTFEGARIAAAAGDSFAIRPQRVRRGQPFVVEIPYGDGARVAIVRDDNVEVASEQLRRGERSIAFIAPRDRKSYTVRVTLDRGQGSESLVRALPLTR
ncbi:MAG: hypothetical protein JOZ24_03400, partial [Candidatus Eremiobacteraeota bacterium]|nr:hypothetical protein [Candidatus Eremiobacteraeota bacterium]